MTEIKCGWRSCEKDAVHIIKKKRGFACYCDFHYNFLKKRRFDKELNKNEK